ncbi:hypothetical protein SBV1_1680013 [Verrucomicrobia bacterium]|nr:hypothetical protein SBV1_1680013 [Verrucomicrobiota bacterium]
MPNQSQNSVFIIIRLSKTSV